MKLNLKTPLFPILLVAFFFIHSLLENYYPTLIKDALWLMLVYSVIAALLTGLSWLVFKDWRKAALAAFALLAFNFFFGSGYDLLKRTFHDSFITRFSFILPVSFILLVVLIIYLKRSRSTLERTTQYLNLLFLLLIVLDTASLIFKHIKTKNDHVVDLSNSLPACDSCTRPDIYLILADEYAGKTELKDLFAFDNSNFENELQQRGFRVINNSVSNYNTTIASMASLLNMDYIKNATRPSVVNHRDMLLCRDLIKKNNLTTFLLQNGYSIHNFSFFDIAGKKKAVRNIFFPSNSSLLIHQTFVSRMLFHFGARFASKQTIIDIKRNNLYNDLEIEELTRNTVLLKTSQPKFVYTHLKKPHHPYFFDSSGKETPVEKLNDEFTMDKKAYIEYLHYSNKKLLSLVDFIKNNSARPPVIFLTGDHGFRQLAPDIERKYWFMNLNAVFFPDSNYSGFYDGMSNVNQFRVMLNTLFRQNLPLLKDSTSFLTE